VRTACRGGRDVGLHRPPARSAGSGNCDQARLAVTGYAMAHSGRVDTRPGAPRVLAKHPCPRGAPGCGTAMCHARPAWIDPGRTRRLIGSRGNQAAAVMSELDVIVIRIRAGQAAQYERLCVGPELPCWHVAPSSAPGSFVLRPALASVRMQPRTSSPPGSQVTPGTVSTTPIPVPGVQPSGRRVPARGPAGVRRSGAPRHLTGTANRRPRPVRPWGRREIPLVPATSSPPGSPSRSTGAPHRAHRPQPQGPSRALPLPPDTQQTA
jgi:hypothetical protein